MAGKKNSLVANINRKKRTGKSRPKSRSTVAESSYQEMQKGWPDKKKKSETSKSRKRKTSKR